MIDFNKIEFFYLPNEIAERKDLTVGDKLLVATVHTIERMAGSPQVLTNRKIAELAGLSQNTLPQRIAKIKDKGIFTITGQSTARRISVNLENASGRFWRIPANEKQTRFKASERIVLGAIETLTTKKRRCTASDRFIGAAGGMSVQTVQSALHTLREAGIVLSTKKFDVDSCRWHRTICTKPQPEKEKVVAELEKWTDRTTVLYDSNIPILFAIETEDGVVEVDSGALVWQEGVL